MKVTQVIARQVLDSRGVPTVEADVVLDDGVVGRAIAPSGASTGSNEAHELRDNDETLFQGKSVLTALQNIEGPIADALIGEDAEAQARVDSRLIELDGTANKEKLGANAILAVSLATAKAAALSRGQFLFEYVQTLSRAPRDPVLPIPFANVLNGGKHANQSADFQEYMLVPVGAQGFAHAVRTIAETYMSLRDILTENGHSTTVGDEGGFAPSLSQGNREPLEMLAQAVERAGYTLGQDISFAIDVAATEFYTDDVYRLASEDRSLSRDDMIDLFEVLATEFPLISIEDGLAEDDWQGWQALHERIGSNVQVVGDDFLVTNPDRIGRAIEESAANTLLVKPNQIGTLSETIEAVDMAHEAGWQTILSHRSGETEDTTIAHLAVGLGTGQIKCGSVARGERTSKYNELLRIEELVGEPTTFNT
jgi:enolase